MLRELRIDFERIQQLSQAEGLGIVSVSTAPSLGARAADRLKVWQQQGMAGSMQYLHKDPSCFIDLARLVPEFCSVLVFAIAYPASSDPPCAKGFGRVARYARIPNYHKLIAKRIRSLVHGLEHELGASLSTRTGCDAIPLLERELAEQASLGFIGKNTMLIRAGEGSFFFLAELISNLRIDGYSRPEVRGGCGTCLRCASACPTGALDTPYTLDARRCISYLTIEKRGMLEPWERKAIGSWIFGCDICQEVCPFNHRGLKERTLSDGALGVSQVVRERLELASILSIRDREGFLKLFAGTALMRAKREGLVRNAIAVAVNTECRELLPVLIRLVERDESEVVRATALWAVQHLSHGDPRFEREGLAILRRVKQDPSKVVQSERSRIVNDWNAE